MKRTFYDDPMLPEPRGYARRGNINSDFTCLHCRVYVTANPLVCRVHNRNHCPLCLWSRHMDLHKAGDRLAACRAPMRPIGLTLKKSAQKYGQPQGELMLIHACTECGAISINRIAADDDNDTIFQVFQASAYLDSQAKIWLKNSTIEMLQPGDAWLVERRLWGSRQSAGWMPALNEVA